MSLDSKSPDFSDVRSGGSSSGSPPPHGTRTYTVKLGDSLSTIAKRTYGDTKKWRVIYEANRSTVRNPDLIHPGQVLVLPEA